MKPNIVQEKSYGFALKMICLARELRERKEYDLARQLLRAGTSVGANIEEAQAGVSRADFATKMSIASKEAREVHYWLRLLRDSKSILSAQADPLIDEAEELIRLLTAIVKTAQSGK